MTNYTTRKLAVLLLLLCTAIIFSLPNQLIALVKWSRDGSFTHRTGSAKEKTSFPEHGDENCKMVLAQNGPDENLNEDEISAMVDPKCEVPSLQKGKVHVIIAGYEGLNDRKGFSDNESYLFDIGLTNADYFWYRRLDAQKPLRHIEGPCGQSFHERLLLPNHGRDASGLYDYIVEFYHNLPDILIFMHGHGAHSYHTNCEAIFARTVYYYRAYVNKNILRCKGKSVLGHRMTLTSRSTTTIDYSHNWYGVDHSRRLNRHNRCREYINAKWGDLFEYKGGDKSRSCCASFIMTSERITRYPLEFWEDMLHLVRDPKTNDSIFSRICFEFILAFLFYDDVDFTFDEVSVFYNEADSLIHGKLRDANSTGPDRGLVERMGKCNMEQ